MMEARGISRSFTASNGPVAAVRSASLALGPGESVSIVGHSGSGKSTLLAMLGGILRPDSGAVFFEERDLWSLSDDDRARLRGDRFAFVYQFPSLIPTLTARQNVLLPTVFGTRTGRDPDALLDLVGLSGKTGRYPAELSGGELQRVAIARAFVNSPALILADEPTGDLDEETERSIMDLFDRVCREERTALIMVTHSEALAARATRRYRMRSGSLEPLVPQGAMP